MIKYVCSLIPDEPCGSGLGDIKYSGYGYTELPVDKCAGRGNKMVYVPRLLAARPARLVVRLLRLPRSKGLLINSSMMVVMFVITRKTLVIPLIDYLQPRKLMIPLPRKFLVHTI